MSDRSQSPPLPQAHELATRWTNPGLARIASLALPAILLAALAVFPGMLMHRDALLTQAVLPVLLIGVGASLAHGLGWRPRSPIFAAAVGPFVAWPLVLATFAFLALGG